jgi:hypothetical protein
LFEEGFVRIPEGIRVNQTVVFVTRYPAPEALEFPSGSPILSSNIGETSHHEVRREFHSGSLFFLYESALAAS